MTIKDEDILGALRNSNGLVVCAARELGCSTQAIYNHAKKNPEIIEEIEFQRSQLIGRAKLGLVNALDNDEAWAVMFTLKTLAKDEGFTERQEVTGANGGPLRHAVGPDLENYTDEQLRSYIIGLSKAGLDISGRQDQ